MGVDILVDKAKNVDEDSFYNLISEVKENLYVIAYSYVKEKEEALDIVSETVIKAYRSINKLKKPELFKSWIVKICINTSIDHYKKMKNISYFADITEIKEQEDKLVNNEEGLEVIEAVKALDLKYRRIVFLKYYNDFTIKEIGEILNMPIGTVKTYLNKALKQLRVDLSEEEA